MKIFSKYSDDVTGTKIINDTKRLPKMNIYSIPEIPNIIFYHSMQVTITLMLLYITMVMDIEYQVHKWI